MLHKTPVYSLPVHLPFLWQEHVHLSSPGLLVFLFFSSYIHPYAYPRKYRCRGVRPADLFILFICISFFKCIKAQQESAEIRNIFSLRCIAINVQCINRVKFIKLVNVSFVALLINSTESFFVHQFIKFPFASILPSLVIKAMCNFMPDRRCAAYPYTKASSRSSSLIAGNCKNACR